MRQTRRIAVSAILALLSAAGALAQPASAAADKADALSAAVRKGDAAAVKKLLDEGVDVNTTFRYNRTALSFAADRGHADVVKLLLDRGADVNAKDTFYNATALTWAVNPAMERTPRHAEVVRLLLQHGAQGRDDALLGAVSAPDAATVKAILDAGGLPPGALSDALEVATKGKHLDVVALLEQAGAKPRVEVKLDAAQLARYAGTYRGPNEARFIVTITGDRLLATVGPQKLTLTARDATTFGILDQPGRTITFKFEQDKVASLMLGPTVFVRIEDK